MQLTASQRFVITWLLLSSLAAVVCSLIWPAAHVGNETLPVSADSFYHARRILDTAASPGAFYEFDPKIHAPEGSLLVWPWGYDYLMGWMVRIGWELGLAEQPIQILVWLPVLAVFGSIGMIMLIGRQLGLSLWFCSLAALCVALSPLTQYLHGVGFVDHHFAEYLFVLATVFAGLRWFQQQDSARAAVWLGIVLGTAPAIHNALFILQIPIVLTLLLRWLLGHSAPRHATAVFGASLLAATVAILIPSYPARAGMFEFYLLSWFQLYIACGTVLCSCFFSCYPRTPRSTVVLVTGGALLLLPLLYQIVLAKAFLTGNILKLEDINEMQSPIELVHQYGPLDVSSRYSLLLWLAPVTWIYCCYRAWRERASPRLFYWLSCMLGLWLLALQYRMHYFGSFALCMPALIAIQEFAARRLQIQRALTLITSLLVLLMLAPPLRNQLLGPMLPANDPSFLNIRESLQVLRRACAEDPGVVLADNDMGHYIRYYTDCSVIANNFLLTPQHEMKIREMEDLLAQPAAALPAHAPFVKYVLMRPWFMALKGHDITYRSYSPGRDALFADLLLKPQSKTPQLPPMAYEILYSTKILESGLEVPYLSLYRIHSPPTLAAKE